MTCASRSNAAFAQEVQIGEIAELVERDDVGDFGGSDPAAADAFVDVAELLPETETNGAQPT